MHALVTGGAGFIGSHLVRELLKRDYSVTVVDNLITGSMRNIEDLLSVSGFDFVEADICQREVLAPLMKKSDYCYHLAAAVGVKRIVDEPLASLEALVHGTSSVLEAANTYRVPIFLASTSEVYGKHSAHSLAEECASVIGPVMKWRWLYACSKMLDEFWALAYHHERDMQVVVSRLFNVSGPRQTGRWGMVVPTFVQQALDNKPITVYGDGEQKRCFLHVSDCVEAIMRLTTNPEAVGHIVNIGNANELSINQLAQRVIELVPGTTSEITHISYEDAYGQGFEDMLQRRPDASLLTQLTGFQPQMTVDQIITDVMDYIKGGSAAAASGDARRAG